MGIDIRIWETLVLKTCFILYILNSVDTCCGCVLGTWPLYMSIKRIITFAKHKRNTKTNIIIYQSFVQQSTSILCSMFNVQQINCFFFGCIVFSQTTVAKQRIGPSVQYICIDAIGNYNTCTPNAISSRILSPVNDKPAKQCCIVVCRQFFSCMSVCEFALFYWEFSPV